ncbi:DUF5895 domain-containing protein [Myxosarcina sp. GI1]|uniref:DUF5895 domain-containing protein n=1 Tax=Myxosarcina sp. GI1 TaxID=1541065 RepID=UPI00056B7AED|nr:DUF5895 domain-containing protein [Myxosarcina sp. GI1]
MNNSSIDFGFNTDEFVGEITTVPYSQFLNASSKNYGLAITSANASLAEFELTDGWQPVEHEFGDGSKETVLLTKQPRLLVLNRSQPLMSNEIETIPYSKAKCDEGGYKAFSYTIVWFLDKNNKPISKLPFRLRCSGNAGYTFHKNYQYYDNSNSFCKKFFASYKTLTDDPATEKNSLFYAHAVYQPTLVREKVTSSVNGKSSYAVITKSFVEPTKNNFGSLIIKNGSQTSDRIKQLIETTKSWLKTESVEAEEEKTEGEESEQDVVETELSADPVPF